MRRSRFVGVLVVSVVVFACATASALAAPETPTIEAELVGMTAQLRGVLNPSNAGEEGSYEFLYRQSPSECEGEGGTSTGPAQAFGVQEEPVFAEVSLEPNATYAFCLLARNLSEEQAVSSAVTLSTPPVPPAVDVQGTSGLTSTGVTLLGQINPNNQETTYAFEYATNEALENATQVPGISPLVGFGDQSVETNLEGLQPRKQYFWRIAASNATSEATSGNVVAFTTFDKPLVEDEAAKAVTRTTASIAGMVNPGGLVTRAHLIYVEEGHYNSGALECLPEVPCAYGEGAKTTPNEQVGGADYENHAVGPLLLGELKPGKIYHYALVATNSEGTRITPDQTFTTSPATPPSASTGEASGVTQLSATLSGTADTRGLPGTMSFQVALSPEGGSLEPASAVAGSQSGTSVSITFSFGPYLQPGTTYYYRAVATNADGSAVGEWRSFTTGTFPSPFAAGPLSIPLLTIPAEAKETTGTVTPPLTRAQKLRKALKACHKNKKPKRAKCERQARHKYAAKHKK